MDYSESSIYQKAHCPHLKGSHACIIFSDERERRTSIKHFIKNSLAQNDMFLYVADTHVSSALEWLPFRPANCSEESYGQFNILNSKQVYSPFGNFAPEDMVTHILDLQRISVEKGYRSFAGTGEMSWVNRGWPGSERLIEYELLLNEWVKDYPSTILCQYDLNLFDGETILDILRIHPMLLVNGQILNNPFFKSPFRNQPNVIPISPINNQIIAELMLVQSLLYAFSCTQKIGDFVSSAVKNVPGTRQCTAEFTDNTQSTPVENFTQTSKGGEQTKFNNLSPFRTVTKNDDTYSFPCITANHLYGHLHVEVDEEKRFEVYEPFIQTLANSVATTLENQWQRHRLEDEIHKNKVTAKQLQKVNKNLQQDVAKRIQGEKIILHQAHYDHLTNLPNRFHSLDRLSHLLTEAQRCDNKIAVLFLDLDDFKKVNDTLGHETGDKLLIDAANRLRHIVRTEDTVGRLGGDEFILLLHGLTNYIDAKPIVDELLNQFRTPFTINNRGLILTASIGIALYPENGDDASELLRNADSAMYHAKKQGGNTYSYFTESMNHEVSRRLALETQICGALDRGEFEVLYQSKIDIKSCRIIGAEALLRWYNPALGHVSPKEFIPVAEQTGLITRLGQFVLTEALNKTVHWQRSLTDNFHIAVNLSPCQFRDPELVSVIEETIKQTGILATSVELEITEGVLMSGHRDVEKALAALSNLGLSIAMDDFGTGYSSLSYLRSYPFNVLKIDRSFINDITIDPRDKELINAAIAMAHGLNLEVVAEGVEAKEQLTILTELGCDYAQGNYFSKPLSAAEMSTLLERCE